MKIGFLRAYDAQVPYQWYLPCLGVGYLASYAKKETSGHEFIFEKQFEDLMAHKPDLLAVSSATENFDQAREFARLAKEDRGIPCLIGGMHITSLPHALPEEFDAGCQGEGEETFVELVNLFASNSHPDPADFAKIDGICYHDGGRVVVNKARKNNRELDELPYPDRDLLGDNWGASSAEQVHMISSRGCPYKCSFCTSSADLAWNAYRWFSAEYTLKEMEFLRNKYNPKVFYFFDDLFIANSKRFKKICKLAKERGLLEGMKFRCYGRVDLITEEMADLLANHNFDEIDFGFESNDAQTLVYLNKTYASPEINQTCVDRLAGRGVSIGANFIIGCPNEDHAAIRQTYDFIDRNQSHFDRMSFGPLQPLPGTPIWHEAVRKGVVSENMRWADFAVYAHSFDIERFPYMAEKLTKTEFWDWFLRFKSKQTEIHLTGKVKRMHSEIQDLTRERRALERQIQTLKGSRLVKAAVKLREVRQRFYPSMGGDNGSSNGNGNLNALQRGLDFEPARDAELQSTHH